MADRLNKSARRGETNDDNHFIMYDGMSKKLQFLFFIFNRTTLASCSVARVHTHIMFIHFKGTSETVGIFESRAQAIDEKEIEKLFPILSLAS